MISKMFIELIHPFFWRAAVGTGPYASSLAFLSMYSGRSLL